MLPPGAPQDTTLPPEQPQEDPMAAELQATMEQYGVDERNAMAILDARRQGFDEEEIIAYLQGAAA